MKVLKNEPMAKHTSFRIGGPAKAYVVPEDEYELLQLIRFLYEEKLPYVIIGNGTDLLVSDEGIPEIVVEIGKTMTHITDPIPNIEYWDFTASAGTLLSQTAQHALKYGLTGMEGLSGIPGTVGGAVVMNAGAYGDEMKNVVHSVTVLTREGKKRTLTEPELDFSYRHSCIDEKRYIVLSVEFQMKKDDPAAIKARMQDFRKRRQEKQPLDKPSAGSTFKRPEGHFAGKLIEDTGLRGLKIGGAQVSEKHCGFIISDGTATATDVYNLIKEVQQQVLISQKVHLEPEVRFLGDFLLNRESN